LSETISIKPTMRCMLNNIAGSNSSKLGSHNLLSFFVPAFKTIYTGFNTFSITFRKQSVVHLPYTILVNLVVVLWG